ncbi:MAG: hypothetical protein JWM93_1803, partial [Frankiales bacterium]|nr:hypothetical protein [Frankiales bacterium]
VRQVGDERRGAVPGRRGRGVSRSAVVATVDVLRRCCSGAVLGRAGARIGGAGGHRSGRDGDAAQYRPYRRSPHTSTKSRPRRCTRPPTGSCAAQVKTSREFNRVARHFGSWRRGKEALALSETKTVCNVEARFPFRRVGKVWRATRRRRWSAAPTTRAPALVAEFDWWRRRELELAAAQGNDDLHLPSAMRYRKRLGLMGGRAATVRLHPRTDGRAP